ncbi:DUF1015 domain-containing protein [Chloroflexota bacterium]
MAEIQPFKGIRYNKDIVPDLSIVLCPPYDVISPELQYALYHKSLYNMVRLEQGLPEAEDSLPRDKYARAAAIFRQWLGSGVLKSDLTPAIYLHHHYFLHEGDVKTRRGIIATVGLEDREKAVVRPHEGTAAVFKTDRLNLIRSCHANFSPILALYEDTKGTVTSILAKAEASHPLLRASGSVDEGHVLWAITDQASLNELFNAIADYPLYIADGHHRYETALTYRNEQLASATQPEKDNPFCSVMMTLVELTDPGVIVLPFHRLVRGVAEPTIHALQEKIQRYFDIEYLPLASPLSATILDNALKISQQGQVVIGVLGVKEGNLMVLRLHNPQTVADMMPTDRSDAYRMLDVSVLHHIILERFLGIHEEEALTYTRSELEAWQRITAGEYQLAFLLNPMDARAVKAVADATDKMPQKSTHFYPKEPAGLVINLLGGEHQGQLL